MKAFIGGSRSIRKLDENVLQALFIELNSKNDIIVGDADGVDAEIQKFCEKYNYKNVTVFASNGKARNNFGNFKVQNVVVEKNIFSKKFFEQKDIEMTNVADYGIIIWDGKSNGSMSQAKRLLHNNKPCQIYLVNEKRWINVENENAIKQIKLNTNIQQLSFI